MGIGELVVILVCALVGGMVQGSLGIGYGLVAGPGLVFVDSAFAPGPILIVGMVVGLRVVFTEHEHIDRPGLNRCVVGAPFGVVAGLVVLSAMDDRTLSILVGAVTAFAAVAMLAGASLRRTAPIEVVAGAATAFSATTAGMPGPPLVVAFSDLTPAGLRSTASAFISLLAVVAVVTLTLTGNFGRHEAGLLAMLLPGTLIGLAFARYCKPYLERTWFRPMILVVACLGGLALIVRNL